MAESVGVVIIDDSAQWIRRLESVLTEIPGLVLVGTAGTPSAALALVSQLNPPIMILDMTLEGGSGVDVLRSLGSQGATVRVVALTGAPSHPLRELCFQLGARYFLDKTFEFDELGDALRILKEEV
jgi:DNA-binding NarL/FixJ family response regulator